MPTLLHIVTAQKYDWIWLSTLCLIFGIFAIGAAISSLGLAMAIWISRPGRAVAASVAIDLVVSIGWMFLVVFVCNPQPYGEGLLMGSPFAYVLLVSDTARQGGSRGNLLAWAIMWMIVYSVTALTFLAVTLVSFNHFLGRVELGLIYSNFPARPPRKPARDEDFAGEISYI